VRTSTAPSLSWGLPSSAGITSNGHSVSRSYGRPD
jgi:hypothetical protein